MGLSIDWHELSGTGSKMQRVMTARKSIENLFNTLFWDGTMIVAMFLGAVLSFKIMDIPFYYALIFMGFVVSYLIVSFTTGLWVLKPIDRHLENLEGLNTKIYEFVNSVATLKIFNLDQVSYWKG